jgi:uncharacterized membrane protein
MSKRTFLVASAAAAFAFGSVVSPASAGDNNNGVKCAGVNSCKGTSACKTAQSSCKGRNSCKGFGWIQTSTASECQAKGGKVI